MNRRQRQKQERIRAQEAALRRTVTRSVLGIITTSEAFELVVDRATAIRESTSASGTARALARDALELTGLISQIEEDLQDSGSSADNAAT